MFSSAIMKPELRSQLVSSASFPIITWISYLHVGAVYWWRSWLQGAANIVFFVGIFLKSYSSKHLRRVLICFEKGEKKKKKEKLQNLVFEGNGFNYCTAFSSTFSIGLFSTGFPSITNYSFPFLPLYSSFQSHLVWLDLS